MKSWFRSEERLFRLEDEGLDQTADNQLPKLITGVKFVDGDEVLPITSDANKNAA